MKKVLTIVILFLLVRDVKAITYNIWLEEKQGNDENLVYDTKTLYKWYKEEKRGEYLLYDIELDKYPYNDLNDTLKADYSAWLDECHQVDYREIEYRDVYLYQEVKKVKYFKILNISKNNKINDIVIKSNDEKINYKLVDNNNLYNDDYYYTDGYAIFELDKEYSLKDLVVKLESDMTYKIFTMYFFDDLGNEYIASYNVFTGVSYNVDKSWLNNANKNIYTEVISSDIPIIQDDFNILLDSVKKCRFRDILTYHYEIYRNYYDDEYHEYIHGFTKDLEDSKTYYKYYDIEGKNNIEYEYIKNINDDNSYYRNEFKVKSKNKNIDFTFNEKKKNRFYLYGLVILILITSLFILKKCRTK